LTRYKSIGDKLHINKKKKDTFYLWITTDLDRYCTVEMM